MIFGNIDKKHISIWRRLGASQGDFTLGMSKAFIVANMKRGHASLKGNMPSRKTCLSHQTHNNNLHKATFDN